jgi:FkbM family methyltransferase
MELDLGDVFDQSLWFGAYEPHLRAVIEALVARGDTCVDIGTHKGFFTLLLARRVGPTGAVLAADPDPRAFSAMTANVRANGFAQVRPHQLAIADGPGHCSFQLTSQLGWSSRFPNAIASARVFEQVTVDTAALDALLAREELPRPGSTLSFVKIDAEGSEPLILRGMQETLERHRPTLHLEINVDSLRVAGETPASVLQPLAARGYGVFEIVWSRDRWLRPRTSLRRLDVATMARSADVICIHHASERGRRLLARFTR